MAQAKGKKTRLLFDYEQSYGVAPGVAAAVVLPFNTPLGLAATQAQNTRSTIRGRRDPVKPFRGNKDARGGLNTPMDARMIGYLLKAMFGAPTTTDNGDGTYEHVFKVVDEQPSFLIDRQHPEVGIYLRYFGCKVGEFSSAIGGDGELVANLDIIAAEESREVSVYQADPSELEPAYFENFQASIKLGGTALGYCPQFSYRMAFGLDDSLYFIGGQGKRGALDEGDLEVGGSLVSMLRDATFLDLGDNATETSIEAIYTAGAHSLSLLWPEVVFEKKSPPVDGPQGIRVEMNWSAYYENAAENSSVVATLINDVATY